MYQLSTELGPIDPREDSCPAALSAFQLGSRVAQTISSETTCKLELGSVIFSEVWGGGQGAGGVGFGAIWYFLRNRGHFAVAAFSGCHKVIAAR